MNKIGIDARLFSQTGVGTYLQNLLFYLDKKNNSGNLYYIYLIKDDYNKINFKSKNIKKKLANFKWHSFSEQIHFLKTLLQDNLDLMHFTYFSYPFFYPKSFIATVHDLTPLFFKTGKSSTRNYFIFSLKHFFYRIGLRLLLSRAKKIITPTKTIKKQLIKNFKIKKEKILTLYEGVSYKFLIEKERKSFKEKFKNFLLYVGNFYPHKNLERLIQAFILLRRKSLKLILVGPKDFFSEKIKKVIEKYKGEKQIFIMNNLDTSDLIYLYKKARALINPSLSEGFGLPIIEASYFNCPVIASNIAVFREILGKNYISFDPLSVNDIKNKIQFFLENRKNKVKLSSKKILEKFSFENMTQKTIDLYDQILKK